MSGAGTWLFGPFFNMIHMKVSYLLYVCQFVFTDIAQTMINMPHFLVPLFWQPVKPPGLLWSWVN